MLLHHHGSFIQCLEGPHSQVLGLYEEIRLDQRHGGLIQLFQADIEVRDFPEWWMGFEDISGNSANENFVDLLEAGLDESELHIQSGKAIRFLRSFYLKDRDS